MRLRMPVPFSSDVGLAIESSCGALSVHQRRTFAGDV